MKESAYNKYMKQDVWFHGTTLSGWKNLCSQKVIADYNCGTELDFGTGFYLAPKYKQAERYIKTILPYLDGEDESDHIPVVIEFELNLSELDPKYTHEKFLSYDDSFAEFVVKNREYPDVLTHSFDYVIGVMTDSNPVALLAEYRANLLTKEELITELKKGTSMEQLSLHNQEICDILRVRKVILIENGKELDVDEYNKK